MRSRSPTARPLERRAKNSAAVSGRSIVIMEIRHKRLNAGEAHALASFQFFDRIARSSAAHQLGLPLRLMGLITRAALGTPIFRSEERLVGKECVVRVELGGRLNIKKNKKH